MYIRRFFAFVISFFLFFSVASYAGLPAPLYDYAVSIKNVAKNGASVVADFAFKKKAANDPSYQAVKKSVSANAMAGGFLKRLTRFGVGAVAFAVVESLLDGTEWVIDSSQNVIYRIPPNQNYFFCTSSSYSSNTCFSTPQALLSHVQPDKFENQPQNDTYQSWTNNTFTSFRDPSKVDKVKNGESPLQHVQFDYVYDYELKSPFGDKKETLPNDSYLYVLASPDSPAREIMTADKLAPYLAAAPVDDLATFLQPQPNVDPSQDPAYQDLYADAAQDAEPIDAIDPDPNPNPDPDPDPDPNPNPDPIPDPIPDPDPISFPDFCTWAKPVCDLVDWFQSDPPEDLEPVPVPYGDLSDVGLDSVDRYEQRITFNAQCPSSQFSFDMFGRTYYKDIPWSGLCEFLGLIAPWLLAMTYLGTAYFVVENL